MENKMETTIIPGFTEDSWLWLVQVEEIRHSFPDPWEDLESRTPIMVPYTTIG